MEFYWPCTRTCTNKCKSGSPFAFAIVWKSCTVFTETSGFVHEGQQRPCSPKRDGGWKRAQPTLASQRNKKESRGKDLKEKRLSEAVEKEDISWPLCGGEMRAPAETRLDMCDGCYENGYRCSVCACVWERLVQPHSTNVDQSISAYRNMWK
jgi:hypothetical protein